MPLDSSVFSQVEVDLQNKKYSLALRKLSMLSVKYSKDVVYLTHLAKTLRGMGDDLALIKALKEIHRTQPEVDNEIEIMQLLYRNAQINEALDIGLGLQEKVLSIAQRLDLSMTLMKIYIEENDFEGVQEVLDQNRSCFGGNDFAIWAQGLVNLSNQDREKALKCFRQAVQSNPSNDQSWVSLALIHQEMGDEELAFANLEKALDCNPLNNSAVKLYAQWSVKKSDQTKKALSLVRFYLMEHEFDEEISLCHVQLLCQLKFWKEAVDEISKLILTQPSNLNYSQMKKNLSQNLNLC